MRAENILGFGKNDESFCGYVTEFVGNKKAAHSTPHSQVRGMRGLVCRGIAIVSNVSKVSRSTAA